MAGLISQVQRQVLAGEPRLVFASGESRRVWEQAARQWTQAVVWPMEAHEGLLPTVWPASRRLMEFIVDAQQQARSAPMTDDEALAAGGWGLAGSMGFSAVTPLPLHRPKLADLFDGETHADMERCMEEAGLPSGSMHRTSLNDVVMENLTRLCEGRLLGRKPPLVVLVRCFGRVLDRFSLDLLRRLADEASGRGWQVLLVVSDATAEMRKQLTDSMNAIDPAIVVVGDQDEPAITTVPEDESAPVRWRERLMAGEFDSSLEQEESSDEDKIAELEWIIRRNEPDVNAVATDALAHTVFGQACVELMRLCIKHRLDGVAADLATMTAARDAAGLMAWTHATRQEAMRVLWWQSRVAETQMLATSGLAAEDRPGPVDRARYLEALADVAWSSGQPDLAEQRYIEAAGLLQSVETQAAVAARRLARVLCKMADVETLAGRRENAERLASQAMAIRRAVSAAAEADLSAARLAALTHSKLADIELAAERHAIAEGHARAAVEEFRAVRANFGDSCTTLRDLSGAIVRLADLLLKVGKTTEAETLHTDGLAIRREALKRYGNRAEALRDLAVSLERVGDFARRDGQLEDAVKFYRQSLEVARRVSVHHGETWVLRRDYSVSLIRLGDVLKEQGERDEAAMLYQKALEVRRGLVAETGETRPELKLDLTVALERTAEMVRTMRAYRPSRGANEGERESRDGREIAGDLYGEALELYEQMIRAWGESAVLLRGAGVVLLRQADMMLSAGRVEQSLELYDRTRTVLQRVVELYGRTPTALRDLSIAIESFGDAQLRQGNLNAAEEEYAQVMGLRRELVGDTTLAGTAQEDLATAYERTARLAAAKGMLPAATEAMNDAIWLQRGVIARFGDTVRRRNRLAVLRSLHGQLTGER